MLEDREIYCPTSRRLYSRSFNRMLRMGAEQNFSCRPASAPAAFLANLFISKEFRKIGFYHFGDSRLKKLSYIFFPTETNDFEFLPKKISEYL